MQKEGGDEHLDRDKKEKFVSDMKARLERAEGIFLVDYQGLNVESINRLRRELKKTDTEFMVVKNRLAKLASQGTDTASIAEYFAGPCAFAITYDDIVVPAKLLVDFSRENEHLKIKAGQIEGKPIDDQAIKRLAELPNRDALLGKALSAMQAVSTSFLNVLNGIIVNLLNVLRAIESKKDKKDI